MTYVKAFMSGMFLLVLSAWCQDEVIGGKLRYNARLSTSQELKPQFEYGLDNCTTSDGKISCDYFLGRVDQTSQDIIKLLSFQSGNGNMAVGNIGNAFTSHGIAQISIGEEVSPGYLLNNTVGVFVYQGDKTALTIISDDEDSPSAQLKFDIVNADGTLNSSNNISSSPNSLDVVVNGTKNAEFTSDKLVVHGDISGKNISAETFKTNGEISANEYTINDGTLQIPDYVFEDEYALMPLKDVETYVKKYRHLPEVPSQKEIKENGLKIGKMNLALLKKVEELTLHTIRQQKIISKQADEIKTQNIRVNRLEENLRRIMNRE